MIVIEVKFKFVSLSNVRYVELVIFVSFFIVLDSVGVVLAEVEAA